MKKQIHKQKQFLLLFALPVFFLAVFFIPRKANAAILVNEIQIGNESSSKNEFIELINTGDADVSLNGFKLLKKTENGSSFSTLVASNHFIGTIKAGEFFVIAHPQYKNVINADLDYSSASYSIAADNTIALFDANNQMLDLVGYGNAKSFEGSKAAREINDGESIGRINGVDSGDNFSDFFLLEDASPGKINVKYEKKNIVYPKTVVINEVLPNPEGDDRKGEFIELYNGGDDMTDLAEWKLVDSKNKEFVFSKAYCADKECKIVSESYLVIYSSDFYPKITLRNSSEMLKIVDPNGEEVSQVSYKKCKSGSYNFDGSVWHWSSFLTPGKENIFEEIPVGAISFDKKIYENVFANFKVNKITKGAKVVWEFGDGHKSYKAITRHKYEKAGTYSGMLTIKKGSQETIQTFSVKVEEYPERNVRIIAVDSNPKGKDSEFETITLENKSKKKVNLNGWSIATGWKKLINHPITEDFEIKAGKMRELTREFSKFSLNNKQLKIELRYPNGEVASKVKYKLEKSVGEGGLYKKINQKWQWILPTINNQKLSTSNQSSAISNPNTEVEQPLVISNQEMEIGDQEMQSKIERENKIKELEILSIEEMIKSESDLREENGQYAFTPDATENDHYAVEFMKDASLAANEKINLLLNYFFN